MFQPVELVFKDQTYTIPANKVLGAIASVESIITLGELQVFAARRAAPVAKMAMAFGALLRYAGAAVTDQDVAEHVFSGGDQGKVIDAIANLLLLMIPPRLREDVAATAAAAAAAEAASGNA